MAIKNVEYSREFTGVPREGYPLNPFYNNEEDIKIRQDAEAMFCAEKSNKGMKGFDGTMEYYFSFKGLPGQNPNYISKVIIKKVGDEETIEWLNSDLEIFLIEEGFNLKIN